MNDGPGVFLEKNGKQLCAKASSFGVEITKGFIIDVHCEKSSEKWQSLLSTGMVIWLNKVDGLK